jgi:hypothetical protein
LVICDIDDIRDGAMGIAVLVARGWEEPVPLIILSRRPDVEEIAEGFGAVEGFPKADQRRTIDDEDRSVRAWWDQPRR